MKRAALFLNKIIVETCRDRFDEPTPAILLRHEDT